MKAMRARIAVLLVGSMMVAAALAGCLGGPKPEENQAPVARIGSPSAGATFDTGQAVKFDGSGSSDPESKPLDYQWNFGDNSTGNGNVTTHAYLLPGKYIVLLEVSDGQKKGTDRLELTITQANRAPVAKVKASGLSVSNEETVELNASETTDADNDALAFSWDFGDGTTGQGMVVSHLYANVGSYDVTLNVSDGKTSAGTALTIGVFQANRPPVPVVKAAPQVAFLGAEVDLDASGSTDADNDSLSAAWDFGDGTNATGLAVKHAFSKVGNYTVSASVSDGKAAQNASLTVTVVPGARILLDWNGTDYGYLVLPEADIELANLTVILASSSGQIDPAPAITELGKGRYRVRTAIVPVKGLTLTVTARYWGSPIAARTLTIYESTALPGKDCTVTMNATTSEHRYTDMSDGWTNLSGSVRVVVRGPAADYVLHITGGTDEAYQVDSGNNVTRGKSDFREGWFNMSFDWGVQANQSIELSSAGNSTITDSTGAVMARLYAESTMRALDHNTTFVSVRMNGTQGTMSVETRTETLGIEEKANGRGVNYSCIKTRSNASADGYLDTPFGKVHLKMFNETTAWDVQNDRYTNTTIYIEFVQSTYSVNDTTGDWTLIPDYSTSDHRFPRNAQGGYHPDPKPVTLDEAFTFHGPMPRELVVGDRITGTNQHGVGVVVEVVDSSVRTVDGTAYTVVHVRMTYSHPQGNATGSSEAWIVSEGNLTGLPLESMESRTWKNQGTTVVSTNRFAVQTVRED